MVRARRHRSGRSTDPTLAAAVGRLREERGMTREQLAARACITVSALGRIELNQADPDWRTVRRIVCELDVSLVELASAVEAEESRMNASVRMSNQQAAELAPAD